jgi:hypothetical protein
LIARNGGKNPAMSIVTKVSVVTPKGAALPRPRPVQLVPIVDGRATITLVSSPSRG